MNFKDMAFAHMLKDYSVFSFVPRLSYAIWNWFVLFNRVHGNGNIQKCDGIITSVGGSKSCVESCMCRKLFRHIFIVSFKVPYR